MNLDDIKKIIDTAEQELYKQLEIQQATSAALIESSFNKIKKIFLEIPVEVIPPKDKEEKEPIHIPSEEEPEEEAFKKLQIDSESDSDSYSGSESYSSDDYNESKRKISEEDDSFEVPDHKKIVKYSDEEMNDYVITNLKKSMENPIKRTKVQPKPFHSEVFKEKDTDKGIYCGDVEIEKNDIEELEHILNEYHSKGHFILQKNPWYRSHFGDVMNTVINASGINLISRNFYNNLMEEFSNGSNVRVQTSIYDRPSTKCTFCGLKRTCHYDYFINNEKENPIGNECYHKVKFLVDFFKTLRNEKNLSIESVLAKLYNIKDNLTETNRKNKN